MIIIAVVNFYKYSNGFTNTCIYMHSTLNNNNSNNNNDNNETQPSST